ncbi:MAG: hypothetical protein ACRED8_12160 [Caulobacteraceae bacterium]
MLTAENLHIPAGIKDCSPLRRSASRYDPAERIVYQYWPNSIRDPASVRAHALASTTALLCSHGRMGGRAGNGRVVADKRRFAELAGRLSEATLSARRSSRFAIVVFEDCG